MAGKDIRHIAEIMKNDLKSACSNPIVLIVLIGIIILPSLYALINIEACWNPYENTGDVTFAVANLDNGSSFQNQSLNIGNELVKDLKNSTKFNWVFVSEKELRDGVYSGKYYAGIIIPQNLSSNVVSIASEDPQQAKLEYVVNIKANPVASKLTDSASNAVYLSLNAKIVEIINLAAYEKLGELQSGLASGSSQLYSGGSQLSAGSAQISAGAGQVEAGAAQVESGAAEINQGADQVESSAAEVEAGAAQVEQGSAEVKQGAAKIEQGSEEIQTAVDPSLIPPGPVKEYVEGNVKLANGSGELAIGSSNLADGSVYLANGSVRLANGSVFLARGSSHLANGSLDLSKGSLSLAAGSQLISNYATQALFTAAASLGASAESLSSITGINETVLGDYFLAPVKLDRNELFPVPNYGSQVSPFYLVLSMWVGALITCAMLKTGISEGTKYSPLEMYFGKQLLFVILSILQVSVTLIGAHILGIYVVNPWLFVASSILVSVVFMILMYSLVSALGNVGKAISIVLLVIQISGTGGIYPVQIMQPIFQILHPYLPMTYAITLIRESQLGIVWSNYYPALIILICIGIATVIASIIIKMKADKAAHYFEKRLEDSGLF